MLNYLLYNSIIHLYLNVVKLFLLNSLKRLDKSLIKLYNSLNMNNYISKYLPRSSQNTEERQYTLKQQKFLSSLLETGGDPKEAAELAGYSEGSYPQVVKTLKQEIIDLASDVLAQSAPKAAFKLVEVMDAEHAIPQSSVKIQAAQTILDRIGLGKADRIDINHNVDNSQGALFILPSKSPVTVIDDAEYAVSEN